LKAKIDLSLIEPRTLLLTVIFSFIWGFKKQLAPIIPVILHDFYNYSSLEIAVVEAFLNGIWFLLIVLLFVAFFYIAIEASLIKLEVQSFLQLSETSLDFGLAIW